MNENEKLVVHKQKDMQLVWNFLNTLQVNGGDSSQTAGKYCNDY